MGERFLRMIQNARAAITAIPTTAPMTTPAIQALEEEGEGLVVGVDVDVADDGDRTVTVGAVLATDGWVALEVFGKLGKHGSAYLMELLIWLKQPWLKLTLTLQAMFGSKKMLVLLCRTQPS